MNSRITDEEYLDKMDELKKFQLYDKIVSEAMAFLATESCVNDNRIIIKYEDTDAFCFLFKIAKMNNTVIKFPIFIDGPLYKIIKFKKQNPTYVIKKLHKKNTYFIMDTNRLLNYLKELFADEWYDDILNDIYAEYYDSILLAEKEKENGEN